MDISNAVQKDRPPPKPPMDGEIDFCLILEGLIPGAASLRTVAPLRAVGRLDRLDRNVPFRANPEKLLYVRRIPWILHHRIIVREQYRVKIEALQGAFVQAGDLSSVTGYADKADQTLFTSFDECFQCPARTKGDLPFFLCRKIVDLEQGNMIRLQVFQGEQKGCACGLTSALFSFRRQEELVPVVLHPGANTSL